MTRGKLPRMYEIPPNSPDFGPPELYTSYLYDTSLALIASTGAKDITLADEILNGILLTDSTQGVFPFVVDYNSAIPTTASTLEFATILLVDYALGYYLEMNPNSTRFCEVYNAITSSLQYINKKRSYVINDGLVPISDTNDAVNTETNLLAYFAFKQAFKVFKIEGYDIAANEIKEAVISLLWLNDKINNGLDNTGVLDQTNSLQANVYGSLFFSEIKDFDKAGKCLAKCEIFSTIDQNTGCRGYSGLLGAPENVWMSLSYLVSLAYYNTNDTAKYKSIIKELNRFIDPVDGGVIGGIKKKYLDEDMIKYKAVDSTALSIIANLLKNSVFKIRTTVSASYSCSELFENDELTSGFTKNNCTDGYSGSSVTYTVPVGRYVRTTKTLANADAQSDMDNNGQAYANAKGECISDEVIGNDYQSNQFRKNNCAAGYTGTLVTFSVDANTFYAGTKDEANLKAVNYLVQNGFTYANSHGSCQVNSVLNYINITLNNDGSGDNYIQAFASSPVNTNVTVYYNVKDSVGTNRGDMTVIIYNGDTQSLVQNKMLGGAPPYTISITNISPSTFNNVTYGIQ